MDFIDKLNQGQKKAVTHGDGPALVLAGAGSGKTRVVTYRIAYLVEKCNVEPWRIMAVTFTNKAADEMKERAGNITTCSIRGIWMGTFHSVCVRILREFSENMPFRKNFVIYDSGDQKNLIRKILEDLDIQSKKLETRYVKRVISNLKNRLVEPEEYTPFGYQQERISEIYSEYQNRLSENNAMDFDDLLFNVFRLLDSSREVRMKLNERFVHKLVDEYQDTNHAQYEILRLLSQKHKNLFVVGDDDQSIYGFRGADLNNILNFEDDFSDAVIYKLERNYRSTEKILKAAYSVVKNNFLRKEKKLWTDRDGGKKLVLFSGIDENVEAKKIVNFVEKELKSHPREDILITYRTNAQSRALEDVLLERGIPHKIVGGVRFYQRMEIKDILAYIKFIVNPEDSVSFWRIINTPRRGIGKVRQERIERKAVVENISLLEACRELGKEDDNISEFVDLIEYLGEIERIDDLISEVIDRTGYMRELESRDTPQAESRIENIEELISTVYTFTEKKGEYSPEKYIAEVGLRSDIDEWNREGAVNLMTLHNTKGLEFPVVFIAGISRGVLPHYRSIEDGNLEEERRLFYVGLTRAREKVYLSWFKRRGSGYRGRRKLMPSQFLKELPDEVIKDLDKNQSFDKNRKKVAKKKDDWVEHPIFGRGKVLRVVDGDKLLISFKGNKKKIKREFFNEEN